MAKSSKKISKFFGVYRTVCVIAVSVWLSVVTFKLVILAGHFVVQAFHTVAHSIPVLG